MAIDDYKVTNAEVQAAHVQAAPNTLTGTAQENKAVFDGYPELLKEKHNGLIDELDIALAEQVDWEEDDDTTPAYIKNKPYIPSKTSDLANDSNYATEAYVDDGLNGKVDKEEGKGLSEEDFTSEEKTKLASVETGAEVNVQADWETNDTNSDAYIKNKPIIKKGTDIGSIIENDTNNIASGTGSHAEGYLTKAVESFTHVGGVGTEAHGYAETVIGQYNDYDAMNEPYAFVIGNGYEDGDRSNAHTTDWQGNAWYAGNVTDGSGNVLSEKADSSDMTTALNGKVDKETGKGLSTNDYTTAEKTKLSGIAAGAEVNVQSDWSQNNSSADDYIKNKPTLPSKTSDLTNDSDYTTKQYVDGKLPIGKASGSIASVKDGADGMPMKSLTATIVPQQSGSGTPSPENIRPISGWESVETSVCGKNLFDISGWINSFAEGQQVTFENDTMTVGLTAGDLYTKPYRFSKTNTTITLSFASADAGTSIAPRFELLNENGSAVGSLTLSASGGTITRDAVAVRMNWSSNYGFSVTKPQIELSTTATAYEPYQGHTHTTSLGRTVYGGTVDVVSGTLTVTHAIVDLGSLYWQYATDNAFFYANQAGIKPLANWSVVSHIMSDRYATTYPNNVATASHGDFVISTNPAGNQILIADSRYTDAVSFKSAMSGVQVVYELATPTTYQLTPQTINTLAGVNNVWADSGDCSIEYVRDIGLALDNLLPDSPTTDGTYTLVCTVSDGKATLAWQSSGASLSSPLSLSSPTVLNSTNDTETRKVSLTEEEGDSNEIR